MLEILIGIISGSISSLGMGGGAVLVLMLSSFLNVEQHIAQATSLIFFIPTVITATIINFKQKLINIKFAFIIILSGSIGALIGSKISLSLNSENLKKYFGIFLLIIAGSEIYSLIKMYIMSKNTHNN